MISTILLTLAMAVAPPSFDVQTLNGDAITGNLVALTPEQLLIDVAGTETSVAMSQLLSISAKKKVGAIRQPGRVTVVVLTDGSTLVAKQYTATAADATITLPDGQTVSCPTANVRTVRLQAESGPLDAEWNRLIEQKGNSDLLVVRKGDSLDYHEGVLHDVDGDAVRFELDGEVLPVKRVKVFGIAYHHAEGASMPPSVCRLTDTYGSSWSVQSVQIAKAAEWKTPTGIAVAMPIARIQNMDFSSGKIVYLSDQKPDSVRWTPRFGQPSPLPAVAAFYAPRFDQNREAGPLQLAGTQYRKGLSVCSRTELVYRLNDESFNRFRAIVGIDDVVRPNGKVRLILRGDDKELFDETISGAEAPRPVDVDIVGVRRITIVVDFCEGLGMGDYLLLCNARLTK